MSTFDTALALVRAEHRLESALLAQWYLNELLNYIERIRAGRVKNVSRQVLLSLYEGYRARKMDFIEQADATT